MATAASLGIKTPERVFPLPSPTHYPSSTLTKPEKYPGVFLLELHDRPDNRLREEFILSSIIPALDDVEREFRASQLGILQPQTADSSGWKSPLSPGRFALVTCGPLDKNRFYSNGLDLSEAFSSDHFAKHVFYRMCNKLLTFPIPTVAAINGHAYAGGFILALCHDYRLMKDNLTKGKAAMTMNEIEFGVEVSMPLVGIVEAKLPSRLVVKKCLTEAHRFTAKDSVELGVVDQIASESELIEKSLDFAHEKSIRAMTGIYGLMKESIYRDTLLLINGPDSHLREIKTTHLNRLRQLGESHYGKPKL
ncbi:ClpP/crotonase-like domain-containing protein [Phakopsora pachyrhizi]|uniref:ClpP/crotonase-like domain-containing protein n=1 Tax=Phakopsora pachyrhizi TaxID=170000 RepID=A0AAV0AJM6_PHAPC|nr:ClpP/crotonase-like domain-containing protein [Phakopsora pachyrhizi]KAI8454680.1 ClpP/crotonase-like domain-containing protein [Phakopsora pachyrhizi]CAH7666965.1 ClpP/crotonase-like domain-containing protein [Phakopsora pachyrhizi]